MLKFFNKVFYRKENGEIYECFKDKKMERVNNNDVNELIFNGRKLNVSSAIISEKQINILKSRNNKIIDKSFLESYLEYGIISKEEFNEILN